MLHTYTEKCDRDWFADFREKSEDSVHFELNENIIFVSALLSLLTKGVDIYT